VKEAEKDGRSYYVLSGSDYSAMSPSTTTPHHHPSLFATVTVSQHCIQLNSPLQLVHTFLLQKLNDNTKSLNTKSYLFNYT